jgi:hypothetical protein
VTDVRDLARAAVLAYRIDSLTSTRLSGEGFYDLDDGPVVSGQQTLSVFPDLDTLRTDQTPESYRFAHKTNVILDGVNRSSFVTLSADTAAAGLSNLTVDLEPPYGGGGSHELEVLATPANVLTKTAQTNPSDTQVVIFPDTGLLHGEIDLGGDASATELQVLDRADRTPRVVTVGTAIVGLGPVPIRYADALRLSKVTIAGGSGGNSYFITPLPHMPTTFLETGSGNDHVTVSALGALFPTAIYADGEGGHNTLTVTSFKPINRRNGGPEVDGHQYLTITTGSVSVFYRNFQHISTSQTPPSPRAPARSWASATRRPSERRSEQPGPPRLREPDGGAARRPRRVHPDHSGPRPEGCELLPGHRGRRLAT